MTIKNALPMKRTCRAENQYIKSAKLAKEGGTKPIYEYEISIFDRELCSIIDL